MASLEGALTTQVVVHDAEVVHEGAAPAAIPPTSLVFGATAEDLGDLLTTATSFSCSLGAAMRRVMASTLSALPEVLTESEVAARQMKAKRKDDRERKRRIFDPTYIASSTVYSGDLDPSTDPRPVLYCCENDHAAVASLKRELRTRVRVVDCMVDRVCTGRRIAPGGVEIDAEPWPGSIVVLEPGFDERLVPFAPSIAELPESLAHADYLSERKFSLVNGMHTVMAFLTLDQIYAPKGGGRESLRRADRSPMESRRRRGCHVGIPRRRSRGWDADDPRRRVAAGTRIIPWRRSRGGVAAATWIFRGDELRLGRG